MLCVAGSSLKKTYEENLRRRLLRCKPLKHKGKISLIVNLLRCKSKEKHVKGYYVYANI